MNAKEARKLSDKYYKYSYRLQKVLHKIQREAYFGNYMCIAEKIDRLDAEHLKELGFTVEIYCGCWGGLADYRIYW